MVRARGGTSAEESLVTVRVFERSGKPLCVGRIALDNTVAAQKVANEARALSCLSHDPRPAGSGRIPRGLLIRRGSYISCWQEWLPGRRLDVLLQERQGSPDVADVLRQALHVAYDYHRVDTTLQSLCLVDEALDSLEGAHATSAKDLSQVRTAWQERRETIKGLPAEHGQHGDLWPGNVLVAPGCVSIIDWELFGTCSVAGFDLFHLLLAYAIEACGATLSNLSIPDVGRVLAGHGRSGAVIQDMLHSFAPRSGLGQHQWSAALTAYLIAAAHQYQSYSSGSDLPWQAESYMRLAAASCRGELNLS